MVSFWNKLEQVHPPKSSNAMEEVLPADATSPAPGPGSAAIGSSSPLLALLDQIGSSSQTDEAKECLALLSEPFPSQDDARVPQSPPEPPLPEPRQPSERQQVPPVAMSYTQTVKDIIQRGKVDELKRILDNSTQSPVEKLMFRCNGDEPGDLITHTVRFAPQEKKIPMLKVLKPYFEAVYKRQSCSIKDDPPPMPVYYSENSRDQLTPLGFAMQIQDLATVQYLCSEYLGGAALRIYGPRWMGGDTRYYSTNSKGLIRKLFGETSLDILKYVQPYVKHGVMQHDIQDEIKNRKQVRDAPNKVEPQRAQHGEPTRSVQAASDKHKSSTVRLWCQSGSAQSAPLQTAQRASASQLQAHFRYKLAKFVRYVLQHAPNLRGRIMLALQVKTWTDSQKLDWVVRLFKQHKRLHGLTQQ